VTASLAEVRQYLDSYLRIPEIPDEPGAVNGLQVENAGRIGSIVAAVDASQATIDGVISEFDQRPANDRTNGPPLLLVHHGLFWDGNLPVTGRRYRRIKALLDHDVALYAAHIPLDTHPDVGNNAVLARDLGLTDPRPFDLYQGLPFGVAGELALSREELLARVIARLGSDARLIPGGPATVRRVGVITGAAGGRVLAAGLAGCDTFITGEGPHHTYFDAMELGINLIYAGHYATETVGVQALADHLARQFGLPWVFHDHPTGM
jgi:dinuclear metal center YbgI/SA1388 family protein